MVSVRKGHFLSNKTLRLQILIQKNLKATFEGIKMRGNLLENLKDSFILPVRKGGSPELFHSME